MYLCKMYELSLGGRGPGLRTTKRRPPSRPASAKRSLPLAQNWLRIRPRRTEPAGG